MYQPVFKFALYNALSWVEWCCDCLTGLLISLDTFYNYVFNTSTCTLWRLSQVFC